MLSWHCVKSHILPLKGFCTAGTCEVSLSLNASFIFKLFKKPSRFNTDASASGGGAAVLRLSTGGARIASKNSSL